LFLFCLQGVWFTSLVSSLLEKNPSLMMVKWGVRVFLAHYVLKIKLFCPVLKKIHSLTLNTGSLAFLWCTASGLCTCKTGALPFGPHLHAILLWLFWRWGVSQTICLGWPWAKICPFSAFRVARNTGVSHCTQPQSFSILNNEMGTPLAWISPHQWLWVLMESPLATPLVMGGPVSLRLSSGLGLVWIFSPLGD
jgi:hypothetical protein